MALTNAQFDRLEREYEERRRKSERERSARRQEAYAAIPGLRELEEELSDREFARAKGRVTGSLMEEALAQEQVQGLRSRRARMLSAAGYAPDYLEPVWECPDCQDTGYTAPGVACSCRKRAALKLLYDQSMLQDILAEENFDAFSLDLYDDTRTDARGRTARSLMRENLADVHEFLDTFHEEHRNLLFTGQAGSGKTFLSNCLAKELLDRFIPVLYLPSGSLFERLEKLTFGREERPEDADLIFTCDLLIIDDLGAELSNLFVGTSLFRCLNERILRRRSTIISTNLSMNDIRETYSDRVASRLMGHYRILPFPNQDIRITKRRLAEDRRRSEEAL